MNNNLKKKNHYNDKWLLWFYNSIKKYNVFTNRSGLRSLGTLLPVLGVTWLFGILAVNEKADVFQYIFVIANSLQARLFYSVF